MENIDLVSIVVPIYNVEEYLEQCLQSIINQTYSNLEIILVDDGSVDNSLSIIKKYAKIDNRIIYVSKENGGQAHVMLVTQWHMANGFGM
ncbi:glycosyltransferase family 2 protein [Bacteroides fragilis]|nr:glycosyltransferase family 2 protein [Bacteroides fragilis]MCZ2561030.1 glycosyltransferase family 2 protein [Bacteroides fragilis]